MAYGASFAPDGRTLAFLTDITGVPQVWTVDFVTFLLPNRIRAYTVVAEFLNRHLAAGVG